MNATDDNFALWSEDFTERMRRMMQEADAKCPEFERKHRQRQGDSVFVLLMITATVIGAGYFVGWLLSQL